MIYPIIALGRNYLGIIMNKLLEILYVVLAFIYIFFPFRWAVWMYNFFVLFQMLFHWNSADSWFYIGKFLLVFGVTIVAIWFVVANADKMMEKK